MDDTGEEMTPEEMADHAYRFVKDFLVVMGKNAEHKNDCTMRVRQNVGICDLCRKPRDLEIRSVVRGRLEAAINLCISCREGFKDALQMALREESPENN